MAYTCQHHILCFKSSSHANQVNFRKFTDQQRATAAGKKRATDAESGELFPAPLVLPDDELSCDARCPPQSLRSWVRLNGRNEVTRRRNLLYIVGPPTSSKDIDYVRDWTIPQGHDKEKEANLAKPRTSDVVDYLAAFYHGMEVRILPPESLHFAAWENEKGRKSTTKPRYVGLNTATESIGIRVRPSPDNVFQGQLDLNDLLDVAISILPDDAYALLMLVEHDLFEDDDDDFCCGRAYGGSRVAVVSMARYNPCLDASQNVERQHAWPSSHCEAYMQSCCEVQSESSEASSKRALQQVPASSTDQPYHVNTPLQAAVTVHKTLSQSNLSGLWFSRVCQTVSHELGHSFGMDHCVYYACVMQGTSCLAEDVRQPPYLCPVDLAKLLRATSANEKERYEALLSFCGNHAIVPMFAALRAWLACMLENLDGLSKGRESVKGSEHEPIEL